MCWTNLHQNIQRKTEKWYISIEKFTKSASSLLHPLFNPGLRFSPNMTPHSNDAPYYPPPSCKKLETCNDQFPSKCPKTLIFDTWSHLIPRLIFFSNSGYVTFFLIYWPLTSCKVSEKTNEWSLRYLKTDTQTDGRTHRPTRVITKDPFG